LTPQQKLNMPLEQAQAWLQGLLDCLKEGGHWYIPRSKTAYFMRRKDKTLLRKGPGDESTEYVAKTLGWKIENKEKK